MQGKDNVSSDATTFWINDARGRFVRNTSSTNTLGDVQGDAMRNIKSSDIGSRASGSSPQPPFTFDPVGSKFSDVSPSPNSGTVGFDLSTTTIPISTEIRPVSIAYLLCIKYRLGF